MNSFVLTPKLICDMRAVADSALRRVIDELSMMAIDAVEPRRRGLGLEEAAARLATLERCEVVRRSIAAAATAPAGRAVFSADIQDLMRRAATVHSIVVRHMDRVTGIRLDFGGTAV